MKSITSTSKWTSSRSHRAERRSSACCADAGRGGYLLVLDDVELGSLDRRSLGSRALVATEPVQQDLLRREQGLARADVDEARLRALLAEQVRDAHPVERAVQRALRDVEVGVEVEVEEPDPTPARHRAGDRSDPDRAVATQHEREFVAREHVGNAVGDRPSSGYDALEVLCERPLAIGTPAESGHVAAIGDRQPCLLEAADEARRSQGSGRLILSRRVRARARGAPISPIRRLRLIVYGSVSLPGSRACDSTLLHDVQVGGDPLRLIRNRTDA